MNSFLYEHGSFINQKLDKGAIEMTVEVVKTFIKHYRKLR